MTLSKYNLNQECLAFIKQIENDCGNDIHIIERDNIDASIPLTVFGCSHFDDGKPIIEINLMEVNKDDDVSPEKCIIHECYHLRLSIDGAPRMECDFQDDAIKSKIAFDHFQHYIKHSIEHFYMFPLIENKLKMKMYMEGLTSKKVKGLNTPENQRNFNIIHSHNPLINTISLACSYLDCWVFSPGKEYLKEFESAFISNRNLRAGIELGRKLIDILKNTPINTLNDFLKIYEMCFKVSFKNYQLSLLNCFKSDSGSINLKFARYQAINSIQERDSQNIRPISNSPIKINVVGRNEPCPCGSGKKYKKCCG